MSSHVNFLLIQNQRWSSRGRPWPRGRSRGYIWKSLASKPQILKNCPVLGSRTALFFKPLKFCWKTPETSRKFCEDLFCFPLLEIAWKIIFLRTCFWRTLALVSLVLGLGHSCPWAQEGLSSEGLSLALDFSCALGLEPCVLYSTFIQNRKAEIIFVPVIELVVLC